MNSKFLIKLRKPLRIALSVSVLLIGLCLMFGCLYLYHNGSAQPYSREAVSAILRFLILPVLLCLGLVLLSFLVECLLPRSEEASPLPRQLRMSLRRMQDRTDLSRCNDALRAEVMALRNDRRLYTCIGWVILILSCVLFLTYGLNAHNFHPIHIDRSVIRVLFWLLPCCAVPFLYGLFLSRRNHSSMVKELELLKSAPKESRIVPPKYPPHHRRIFLLRSALLVVGLIMLVYGLFAGGGAEVLTKAANICTECVGLG